MNRSIAVVGAGITGATIARKAAELGWDVIIFDQRNHIGGNCYDYPDLESFTHKYGPHLFHTSNERVMAFLAKYADFAPYFHKVNAYIDGGLAPIPFSLKTLEYTHPQYLCTRLSEKLVEAYGFGKQTSIYSLLTSSDSDLKGLGDYIYSKVFEGYSKKQWGIEDPLELDKGVLNRIPVRVSMDTNYFTDKYQCLPQKGYSNLIASILNHPKIEIRLNERATFKEDELHQSSTRVSINGKFFSHIFYCGMVDELFRFKLGSLEYRSLHFESQELPVDKAGRPSMITNFSCNFAHTRIADYSHLAPAIGCHPSSSRVITEYPGRYEKGGKKFNIPYYPLFTAAARELHKQYQVLLKSLCSGITVCGRLGDYKYYDMDDAVAAALGIIDKSRFLHSH